MEQKIVKKVFFSWCVTHPVFLTYEYIVWSARVHRIQYIEYMNGSPPPPSFCYCSVFFSSVDSLVITHTLTSPQQMSVLHNRSFSLRLQHTKNLACRFFRIHIVTKSNQLYLQLPLFCFTWLLWYCTAPPAFCHNIWRASHFSAWTSSAQIHTPYQYNTISSHYKIFSACPDLPPEET